MRKWGLGGLAMLGLLAATPAQAQVRGSVLNAAADDRVENSVRGHQGAPGTVARGLSVNGERRHYLLHLPRNYGSHPLPLVISLHGLGSSDVQAEQVTRWSSLADAEEFAVAYPQAQKNAWQAFGNSDNDVKFIAAMIDDIALTLRIDRKRIYVDGLSNGAQMAWRLACAMPNALAAVGMVAGGYPNVCASRARPPIMMFQGTADRILPYEGRAGQMSVRSFAREWAANAGCQPSALGRVVADAGNATGEKWSCPGGPDVVLFTLEGKGHSWPGSSMPSSITSRDVDATSTLWAFYKTHPRP